MNPFTDEDLKRLKGDIGEMESVRYPYLDVKALIARLECAEAYAEFRLIFSAGHDGERKVLNKWLASKGEGGDAMKSAEEIADEVFAKLGMNRYPEDKQYFIKALNAFAEKEQLQKGFDSAMKSLEAREKESEEQQKEIERLREALERISEFHSDNEFGVCGSMRIAKAALGQESVKDSWTTD